jgi:hypothetical protein
MPNSYTLIELPLNTNVSVTCTSNSAAEQRVTITQADGTTNTATGSGENVPMQGGAFSIQTPQSAPNDTYTVTVDIESNASGSWSPSQVFNGGYFFLTYALQLVVSEDSVDRDFNDAVVQFSWWKKPGTQQQQQQG